MSTPDQILHLEWRDFRGDQERRYRKPLRCAEQLAAILAAPDEIARLKGLWRTAGWDTNRLEWEPVDLDAFLEECLVATPTEGELDDERPTLTERYERTIQNWADYQERTAP